MVQDQPVDRINVNQDCCNAAPAQCTEEEDRPKPYLLGTAEDEDRPKPYLLGTAEDEDRTKPYLLGTAEDEDRPKPYLFGTAEDEDRPKPYLLGTAEDEDRVPLVKRGLGQQSTGLGIFRIPAGAAVNPVYHLPLGVH